MTKRVLILEDSPTQAMIISRMFERAGFSVIKAHNHSSASQAMRDNRFDLLVLDVFIESSSSLENLEAYRQLCPEVPIAIMTAGQLLDPMAGPDALNKARRARVEFLLPKPFRFEDVAQVCEDVRMRSRPDKVA